MRLYEVTRADDSSEREKRKTLLESQDLAALKKYANDYANERGVEINDWEQLGLPAVGGRPVPKDKIQKQKLDISEHVYLLIDE